MISGSTRLIPNYVKSRTPEGVRRLFLQRQAMKRKQFVVLGNPVFDGEFWFVWFTEEVTMLDVLSQSNKEGEGGD